MGIARLLAGEVDDGIDALVEAAARAPDNPGLQSDLAAAILTRGMTAKRPDEVVRALSLAQRARAASPAPEPLFNIGIALEVMGLRRAAVEAWDRYLSLDASSEWAAIARQHRDVIVRGSPAHGEKPAAAADYEQRLLQAWPDDIRRGLPPRAARARAIAGVGGENDATADKMPADAVRALPLSRAADDVAAALSTFREARDLYDQDQPTAAAQGFTTAYRLLARHAHPYAQWAELYVAISKYLQGSLDDSSLLLNDVLARADARGYVALAGRARYMKGLIAQTRADPITALAEYQSAIANARVVKDPESEASALSQIAGVRDMLGDPIAAWQARFEALRLIPRVANPRRRHVVLLSSARAALADGAVESALDLAGAALDNAREWSRPGALTEVHVQLARIEMALGHVDAARVAIEAATHALQQVTDAPFARRFELELLAASAEAQLAMRGSTAVDHATAAIARLREARGALLIPGVLRVRAKAWLARGQPDLAEADLTAALAGFEEQRASVPLNRGRVTSFPERRAIVGELVKLYVTSGRPDLAFAAAERGRARSLLETRSAAPPLDVAGLRARLRPGVAIVYYAVTDDRIFAWTITHEAPRLTTLPIAPAALADETESFRRALERFDDRRATEQSRRLFAQLIAPVSGGLGSVRTLIIVPDDLLCAMPFAALQDPASNRYLMQTYRLSVSPSATLAVTTPVSRDSTPFTSALVIAPAQSASDLPALQGADAEARFIGRQYARTTLLLGHDATKQRILRELGRNEVVHFAGHSEASVDYPDLSRLIVSSPAGTPNDALYAYDLNGIELRATRLVVLAGCRTGTGRALRGEGVLSLARPFVGAGVPAVIATLWDVRDRPSRVFFERLHVALRAADPVTALQQVQAELLESTDPELRSPGAWAGIYVITSGLAGDANATPRPRR